MPVYLNSKQNGTEFECHNTGEAETKLILLMREGRRDLYISKKATKDYLDKKKFVHNKIYGSLSKMRAGDTPDGNWEWRSYYCRVAERLAEELYERTK
jgi:hypothetical protein